MVAIQALIGMIFRSAGKILNTAFGWATSMLFGKVPENRQIYVSVIAFGSVIWIVALLGVIFPAVASFLLAFVTLPPWVPKSWIRLAFLAAAILLPVVVGVVSLLMLDPEDRPAGIGGKAKAVLKGYPYTLGLALTLIMMTAFAPILKVRTLIKRWTDQHVPVVVEANDYLDVVGDVQQALARGGLRTERRQASWMMRFPTRVLTLFAGGAVEHLVADRLTVLAAPTVEVTLHPSDLIISGKNLDASHAHAVITEQLTFTKAYMTWSKDANKLEDRLRAVWQQARATSNGTVPADVMERLERIGEDLHKAALPYEEWETLFHEKLVVERALLRVAAGITDRPREPTEASPRELQRETVARGSGERSLLAIVPLAMAALAGAALAARALVDERPRLAEHTGLWNS